MGAGDNLAFIQSNIYNWAINPAMTISQRADFTSPTAISHNQYHVDRWLAFLSVVTGTIEHKSIDQPPFSFGTKSIKMLATNTVSGRIGHTQRVELFDELKGREVTVSLKMKSNNVNARLTVWDDDTGDYYSPPETHTGGGGWELLKFTLTIPAGATLFEIHPRIGPPTGTTGVPVTTGDYVEITEVRLEMSPVANQFIPRTFSLELRLCQRYYETSYEIDKFPGANNSTGVSLCSQGNLAVNTRLEVHNSTFKVEKRAIPAIRIYAPNGVIDNVQRYNGAGNVSVSTVNLTSLRHAMAYIVLNAADNGETKTFHWTADAEL